METRHEMTEHQHEHHHHGHEGHVHAHPPQGHIVPRRPSPEELSHIQAGRIKPSDIITHRFPLDAIADAYHIFSSKLDNCIKPVLIPPSAMH